MTEGYRDDGTMIKKLARFDLPAEMERAERQKPWPMGHFATMLFKKPDFRMVLISMEKGSVLKDHHADATLSIQVLKGRLRFTIHGEAQELGPQTVLTLGASLQHQVEALEDAALLLTLAWPTSDVLESMEHRGYGS